MYDRKHVVIPYINELSYFIWIWKNKFIKSVPVMGQLWQWI